MTTRVLKRLSRCVIATAIAVIGCQNGSTQPPSAPPTIATLPAAREVLPVDQGDVLREIEELVASHQLFEAQRRVVTLPVDVIGKQIKVTRGTLQLAYADALLVIAPERHRELLPILLYGERGADIARSLCTVNPMARATLSSQASSMLDLDLLERVATKSTNSETRCEALQCMGKYFVDVPAIRAAMNDRGTTACALQALGRVSHADDLEVLVEHLRHPDEDVVNGAIEGLRLHGYEAARDALYAFGVEAGRAGKAHLEDAARRAWLDHSFPKLRPGVAGRVLPQRVPKVMDALVAGSFTKLAALVHPDQGLRFGYHGDLAEPRFMPKEVGAFASDNRVFTFGTYDGSDELNVDVPRGFIAASLQPASFRAPDRIGFDAWVQQDSHRQEGYTSGNLAWALPDAVFAQLVLDTGSPQNPGMWSSLTLFFAPYGDDWRLVALVHDGWTI